MNIYDRNLSGAEFADVISYLDAKWFGAAAPAAVPEPSTLVLTALGLLSLAMIGWRSRTR